MFLRATAAILEQKQDLNSFTVIRKNSEISQEPKQYLNSFTVIRKCNTAYEAKIQEALLIKKQNPKLNKQLYANGASFLLNIY